MSWMVKAVTSLAHLSGTGRFLHPSTFNSAPHSSDTMSTTHTAPHHLAAHSFIVGQSRISQPVGRPTASYTSSEAVALVYELLSTIY